MIKRLAFHKYSALYMWAVFLVLFGVLRPHTFLTAASSKLVVTENVIVGVLAIAFLVPLATGTCDLAIGRSMSMAPDAARLAGVRTDRLVWASLVASTVIAGFAGLIYSWKVGTYGESIEPGYLFPAIAAVFFRASQLKGRPNVWGALIALLALATGVKGLQLTFSSNTNRIEPLFQGLSLLVAVSLASRHLVMKAAKRCPPPPPPALAADPSAA